MTHAAELARLRDAVVDAAIAVRRGQIGTVGSRLDEMDVAVDALTLAEKATCGTCGGTGETAEPVSGHVGGGIYLGAGAMEVHPCPAGCREGRIA